MTNVTRLEDSVCEQCGKWRRLPADPNWGNCKAYMAGAMCKHCMTPVIGECENNCGDLLTCQTCAARVITHTIIKSRPNGITPKQGTCHKFRKSLWLQCLVQLERWSSPQVR